MTEARDLFEELRELVGCTYISDLRYSPWREQARMTIARMELSEYSLTALCDIAEYLYGGNTSFSSVSAAQDYFRDKIN